MKNFYQYLVEIDAWNGTAVETVQISGNPPITVDWAPHLNDPGLIRVEMFSGSKTYGQSTYSFGEIIVNNFAEYAIGETEGPLDYLKAYSFDGRAVRVYQGDHGDAYGDFVLVIDAVITDATFEWDKISFAIKSKQVELDIPVDGGTFLGDNVLPAGVEGVETDLKDKPKPVLLGRVFNATPVLCNTSKLIYAVSPSTGVAVSYMGSEMQVYDSNIPLTLEGVYIDQADMEANEPSPGCFRVWEVGGYFRIGSTPYGTITFDGCSFGRSVTAKMSNLIIDLLTLHSKQAMVNQVSFDAMATLARYENGIYISNSMPTISSVIDTLCQSVGAYWYFNIDGEIILGQFVDPAGTAVDFTVNSDTDPVEDFLRTKTKETPGGMPIQSFSLRYGKNYTPNGTSAGSVTPARLAWSKEQWRTNQYISAAVLEAHPTAGEITLDTTLTENDDAETLRRFNLYSVERDLVTFKMDLDFFGSAAVLYPGLCFSLNLSSRFDFISKEMVLIGYTVNHQQEYVTLSLWG